MSDPKPTKEDEGRARGWLGRQFPSQFMNADIASLTAEFASVRENAVETAKGTILQFYPHMCRDEHEEIGFRGDSELCPVDKALAERTDEAKRIVDEVLADRWPVDVFPAPPPKEHGSTVDACSAAALRKVIPELRDEIKRRLEALK